MKTYCLVCKGNTKNEDAKIIKTKNNTSMVLSKCSVCGNEKSKFIKHKKQKGY